MKTSGFTTNREQAQTANAGVAMTIDPRAVNYITKALETLYSSPSTAMLREYTSNAVDAHIAAGVKDKPVQITITDTELIIRDFGAGMSLEMLTDIYSRFGATTKRDTNKQVGGFGFGGKSALAFTDSFLIESIHEGQLVVATVKRDSGQPGFLNPSTPVPTKEPSGTTITIPLNMPKNARYPDASLGRSTAMSLLRTVQNGFFSGYAPDAIHVNGNPVGSMTEGTAPSVYEKEYYLPVSVAGVEAGWLRGNDKEILASRRSYYSLPELYIGGVHYNWPNYNSMVESLRRDGGTKMIETYERLRNRGYTIALNVPVGAVDIPASRESITDSPKTSQVLLAILKDFLAGAEGAADAHLASYKNEGKAYQWWSRYAHVFPAVDMKTGSRYVEYAHKATWKHKSFLSDVYLGKDFAGKALYKNTDRHGKTGKPADVRRIEIAADLETLRKLQTTNKFVKGVIVFYKNFNEAEWNQAKNNVTDYMLGKHSISNGIIYYLPEDSVDKTLLSNAYEFLTVDELVEEGRRVRRERRKKPTTRKKVIYHVVDPSVLAKNISTTSNTYQLKNILTTVDSEDVDDSYAFVKIGAKASTSNAFVSVLRYIAEKGNSEGISKNLISSVLLASGGRKVILLPSARSSAALVKKAPGILDVSAVIANLYQEALSADDETFRDEAELYSLAKYSFSVLRTGELLNGLGALSMVTDENQAQSLIRNALTVTDERVALYMLGAAASREDNEDVIELRHKYERRKADLGCYTFAEKLALINFMPGPRTERAKHVETVVQVVNALAHRM